MTMVFQRDMNLNANWYLESPWRKQSFDEIAAILQPPSEFPCYFSQNAFRKQNIVFMFVESMRDFDLRNFADDLRAYLQRCKEWDGKIATAEPLLVVFNPCEIYSADVAGYHEIGWRVLQFLHDHDEDPWPESVAKNPDQPFWSMCYAGVEIFVNMSNPAHARRRSRNLGQSLCFVINPRERFDIVAGNDERGWHIRTLIRDRIHAFDGMEHSPQLGSYKAGEIEWWQYGLAEANAERQDICPFSMKR